MLTSLRELRKAACKEDEFFNKVHVMSLELTIDVVRLSGYWATRTKDGEVVCHGKTIQNWTLNDQWGSSTLEACR